jgi:hypothetical protein
MVEETEERCTLIKTPDRFRRGLREAVFLFAQIISRMSAIGY